MKRILALALLCVMIAGLFSGCGGSTAHLGQWRFVTTGDTVILNKDNTGTWGDVEIKHEYKKDVDMVVIYYEHRVFNLSLKEDNGATILTNSAITLVREENYAVYREAYAKSKFEEFLNSYASIWGIEEVNYVTTGQPKTLQDGIVLLIHDAQIRESSGSDYKSELYLSYSIINNTDQEIGFFLSEQNSFVVHGNGGGTFTIKSHSIPAGDTVKLEDSIELSFSVEDYQAAGSDGLLCITGSCKGEDVHLIFRTDGMWN